MAEESVPRRTEIVAGDVIDVQLTSETVVIQGSNGARQAEPGHILNRMRLFVRDTAGAEKKFDFEDTELGVRDTQRVAVVRGRVNKRSEPLNLILFNLSSGEHDTFEQGLFTFLGRKPFFGPLWKATAFALGTALVFWFVSNFILRNADGGLYSISLALMFGFLTYPVYWWLCRTWDRITERMRYKSARKRFITNVAERVRAYSPKASAPVTTTASAPETPPAPEPSGA
jgi:hypothetical protein